MKITLLGSDKNINQLLIPMLINEGHQVTVITHHSEQQQIRRFGATPAVGSITDKHFLTEQFTGADAVYLMLGFDSGLNPLTDFQAIGHLLAEALQLAGVRNVVNLSYVGADQPYAQVGVLSTYHFIEDELRALDGVNVAVVRSVGQYSSLFSSVQAIKTNCEIMTTIPANVQRGYVAPIDIAIKINALLQRVPAGKTVDYVVSDMFTGAELLTALKTTLRLPNLRYVVITDDQFKQGLLDHQIDANIVEAFTLMNTAQRHPEKMYADMISQKTPLGKVKLADFAQEFGEIYREISFEPATTAANTRVSA